MKHISTLLVIACISAAPLPAEAASADKVAHPVWLVKNGKPGTLPKNFRTTEDKFQSGSPSREGLDDLHASGSGEFSEKQLEAMKARLKEYRLINIDLRQESHGLIDGEAYSWFSGENEVNRGKTLDGIETDERQRLQSLKKLGKASVYDLKVVVPGKPKEGRNPVSIAVHDTETEEQACEKNKIEYCRIPVADYHCPTPDEVDRFVGFVKSLSSKSDKKPWLHFHCKAGRGRTTTFLAMYDMMKNANRVTFEAIVERQKDIGGVDLTDTQGKVEFKRPYTEERARFIRTFYDYCKAQADSGFKQPYSRWKSAREHG